MNQQPQPISLYPVERGDELSLIELWKVLVEYKLLIIVFTALTTLGAIYYASTLPIIYKAEVLMMPAKDISSGPGPRVANMVGFNIAGISVGGGSYGGVEGVRAIARLNTRSFLINHAKEKNLKPILFADQWDKVERKWTDLEPSDRETYELLLDMIRISMNTKDMSGVVSLSVKWENPGNPNKIADIANGLVNSINSNAKKRAILEANSSISFLEKELVKTNIINSQVILYNLIQQQTERIMLANVRDEFVFKVIDTAVNPIKPEPSKMIAITLLSGFLGGFISIFLALFHNYIKKDM